MEGLGQEKDKYVSKQMALPATLSGILDAVRKILNEKSIHSIHIEKDQPIIYQRAVDAPEAEIQPGSDPDYADLSPYEIARRVPMTEFDFRMQGLVEESPIAKVSWMMVFVEKWKLVPTYLLVAQNTNFWKWLGFPVTKGLHVDTFLGMRVEREVEMPPQAFLIFGAEDQWAAIHETKLVIKGTC